jgi:hypothetical protein
MSEIWESETGFVLYKIAFQSLHADTTTQTQNLKSEQVRGMRHNEKEMKLGWRKNEPFRMRNILKREI